MAKMADTNEKIAKAVVKGYKTVEHAVVGGYQAVEDAVTGGYQKIENSFVDTFLSREGETTEEAKARMNAQIPGSK